MAGRILARIAGAALTIFLVCSFVFLLTRLVPADPAVAVAGARADAETLANVRRQLLLDRPVWWQYGRFLANVASGDLGVSYVTRRPVIDEILPRLPVTLMLATAAVLQWLLVGIPVGLYTARRPNGNANAVVVIAAVVGLAIPSFWLARLLQYSVAYRTGLLPVGGWRSAASLVLPSVTLGATGVAYYARLVHVQVVTTLAADHVRVARAKGLPEWVVIGRHVLPNALLPLLAIVGSDFHAVFGGVIFTESIFALPGLGSLTLQAVLNMDLPLIVAIVLVSGTLLTAANVVADAVHSWFDPRLAR